MSTPGDCVLWSGQVGVRGQLTILVASAVNEAINHYDSTYTLNSERGTTFPPEV
jgi:hypothetical protein